MAEIGVARHVSQEGRAGSDLQLHVRVHASTTIK